MIPWLPYVFWVLAIFFNAIMDATENAPNFNESILRNLPNQFWLKEESWKHAKKIFGFKLDAWHIAKSLMITCICATVVSNTWVYLVDKDPLVRPLVQFAILGISWNFLFNLFYHGVLKVK